MRKINLLKTIILILIIIAILIIIIINIIENSMSKNGEQEIQYSKNEQFVFDDINENLVKPQFSGLVLMKYKGDASQESIISNFHKLATKLIPMYYEMLSEKDELEIKKYYNTAENKKNIEKQLGITEYECFIKMEQAISKLKGKKLVFKSYKIIKNSVEEVEEGIKARLIIQYEDNEELELEVLVKNNIEDGRTILVIL